jgi:fructokinase
VQLAKSRGAVISYDPNYRAPLWPDVDTAKREMRQILPYVDIMKLSDEETMLLTDRETPEDAAKYLNGFGIPCVAVTLGKKGALVGVSEKTATVPGYRNPAVDTTGAGDAFWGGFLYRMLTLDKKPGELTLEQAGDCADWGNAVATGCVQKRGAIPAMPTLDETLALMRGRDM